MNLDYKTYVNEAERLAKLAGQELRTRRQSSLIVESKNQPRELVTEADRAAELIVVGGLQDAFPDHGILAEEGVLTTQGKASNESDWLWIIDPLDGTTNFVHGLPFYCVAIALAFQGDPVVGVVHAPELGQTFVATLGGGAVRRNADGSDQPLSVSSTNKFSDALLATGFSYNRNEIGRDDNSANIARVLPHCRDLRRLGSAELDLCLVASGQFDGYWERYLAPYDVAAGAIIVREAGGSVTDYADGNDWLFGDSVVASNGSIHQELRKLLNQTN